MKIGIDISQVVYEGTGVSRFTKGFIDSICTYDKKNEWVFFFSGLRKRLEKNIETKIHDRGFQLIEWNFPPTVLSFLWNDLHKFKILNLKFKINLDWFISSDWAEPPLPHIKKATIVHDLVYLRYPETVDEGIKKTQSKRLNWVKKESQVIFADSQATKDDLINLLKIDGKKIIVNYPGVDIKKPSPFQIKQTLKKYNLKNKNFILTVGKLEPRKNLERLIKAFQELGNRSIQLIIAGPEGWGNFNNLKFKISNLKFSGYVSDEELYSLYSSCLFFILPSLWEGFGYPLVEAMKFDVPVAYSNTSSLYEIGLDTGLSFNPMNINEMIQSINKLSQDASLRNRVAKNGLERSKVFTWKQYYNTIIDALQNAK